MYQHKLNIPDEMEKESGIILKQTTEFLKKASESFEKDVFSKLCDDIETWIFERFENVRRQYFDGIRAFLCGETSTYIEDSKTLSIWLHEIGYTPKSFRKKIFEENKQDILEAITDDAIHERLKHSFVRYFGGWEFSDITTGYPQSDIINSFMEYLMTKKGFDVCFDKKLSKKIKSKQEELARLNEEIIKIKESIYELVD